MFSWSEYLVFTMVYCLALISPGPDFALISRNSLMYSGVTGRRSAVGIASGILVHVAIWLIGLGFIIEKSILVFSVMKLLGAAYLMYLGFKALRSKAPKSDAGDPYSLKRQDISASAAFKMGFMTNALNPKCSILMASLFTQFVSPTTPLAVKMLYGGQMFVFTLIWFTVIATVVSALGRTPAVKSLGHYVEKLTGAVLILCGARLAFARSH